MMSKLGYCSRSMAAELIRSGKVQLNGKIRRDPEFPVTGKDFRIAVDGKPVAAREKIYLMMNKPRGLVTTAADEKGRATVYELLGENFNVANGGGDLRSWVAPVGRLDKASEGLLLLTNDSEWGARIAAPATHLEKTYHVQIGTVADEKFCDTLIRGVTLQDREVLRVKRASRLRAGQKNFWIEIVLDQGRNRHIRRMMEALNVEVLRLVRVAIGPLPLGNLENGECRPLNGEEKRMLDRAIQGKES